MKKPVVIIFCLFALLQLGLPLAAQTTTQSKVSHSSNNVKRQPQQDKAKPPLPPKGGPRHNDDPGAPIGNPLSIEDFIDDLSVQQKTMLDVITRRTAKKLDVYRAELSSLRDTIRILMDGPEDNSDRLFPLYDREGRLQAEISKEFYRCKVAMDAVLTPEQLRRLQESLHKQGPPDHQKQPGRPAKSAKK